MTYEKYLNIGSVVLLKGGEKRIMVIGYLPMPEEEGLDKMYDYIGCIFPEGLVSSDEMLVFNHDQIDKVYNIGYEDEESITFKNNLKTIENEIKTKGIDQFKSENELADEEADEELPESENPEEELNIEEIG